MDTTEREPEKLGLFLSLGSATAAEVAGVCGLDWVLIDLEHGCEGEKALPDQLRALRGTGTMPIVRSGGEDHAQMARALDWGARGVMVPHVNDADKALRCARAISYPPAGSRGVSRTVPACAFGLRSTGESPRPLLLAQIETAEAVGRAAEIAAVDGVDVLFVGPADLSYDLEARRSPLGYTECLEKVAAAAREAGKQCGILLRGGAGLEEVRRLGYTWLAMDSDLSLIRDGIRRNLTALGRS
jgi:2-keto-3-deoxy-L-rhamnonate aldolase RhmA